MRELMRIPNGRPVNMLGAADLAATLFVRRIAMEFNIKEAFLFGSHARHTARTDSDVDVAIVLNGKRGRLIETVFRLSNIAYDIFTETGVLIDAHPLWDGEWDAPNTCPNPSLGENIKKDGVRL